MPILSYIRMRCSLIFSFLPPKAFSDIGDKLYFLLSVNTRNLLSYQLITPLLSCRMETLPWWRPCQEDIRQWWSCFYLMGPILKLRRRLRLNSSCWLIDSFKMTEFWRLSRQIITIFYYYSNDHKCGNGRIDRCMNMLWFMSVFCTITVICDSHLY